MTAEDYLLGIGKIVGNLHALEHVLRIFLCEANGEKIEYPTSTMKEVDETSLTNYDQLGTVIDKFNGRLLANEQNFRVDRSAVCCHRSSGNRAT
jgi:hypothetical protein